MKYDCVVIGAGVSGLSAAVILAQNGRKVAIVEKNSSIAPLLRRFKRGDLWCDVGFHYSGGLRPSGILSVLFRYMGLDGIEPVPMDPDGFDIVSIEGEEEFCMPCGLENVRDALSARFPVSRDAVSKYIERVDAVNKKTSFVNGESDLEEFSAELYDNQSLREFLVKAGAEEGLSRLLGCFGYFLYGSCDAEVPMYFHSLVAGSFYSSADTLKRGGDAIVDAFDRRLEQEGVDTYCGRSVTGLKVDEYNRLTGVMLEQGDLLETSSSICTFHPQSLIDILPAGSVRPVYLKRLRNLENTFSAFAVYLDAKKIPEKITRTNYYRLTLNKGLPEPAEGLAIMSCNQKAEISDRKGLCILKKCHNDSLVKYFSNSGLDLEKDYSELKARETEDALKSTFQCFPELKSDSKVVASASPATFNRYTGTKDGSIYGAKHTISQRDLHSKTSIKGLYLAGQSIKMPGVLGAIVSSLMAVANILEPVEFWNEVRKCR
jgi:all-trans-retinol 13,14-reductase